LVRVGPHPHALRLDSLRSLAAAAGATPFANHLDDFEDTDFRAGGEGHGWGDYMAVRANGDV
jgi:hypothetical protein